MKNVSLKGLPIIRVSEKRAIELSRKPGFRYHSKSELKIQNSVKRAAK
tara:strand:- start:971 stop:1114 length:144 start_codon:yes stop_codon:yes gene_type:complete